MIASMPESVHLQIEYYTPVQMRMCLCAGESHVQQGCILARTFDFASSTAGTRALI